MTERSLKRKSFLQYADPNYKSQVETNVLPTDNTELVSELEYLKKHLEERIEERGMMMIAGKNLEHEKMILQEELIVERESKQELIDSSDQLMSQLSKRFEEMESLKGELIMCSKEKVREVIKEDLQDCSKFQEEISSLSKRLQEEVDEVKFLKTKVNSLQDELEVLRPVKGYECRKPYDYTADNVEAERISSCVEVSGPRTSFDNDASKVPGGRFNQKQTCTAACKEDRSHLRKRRGFY